MQLKTTRKYKAFNAYAVIDLPLQKDTATLHALLPALLLHGTASLPAPALLMRAVESLYGANMHARIGKHGNVQTLEYILQTPDERIVGENGLFERALQLFAEMIFSPHVEGAGFSGRAVGIEKNLHKQKIANLINDKMSYAAEKCIAMMAANEPYGIPRLGYAKDLEALEPTRLLDTYMTIVHTKPMHLYLVGDLGEEEARSAVARSFGRYVNTGKPRPSEPPPFMQALLSSRTVATATEDMVVNQSKLNFGLRSGINYASDDYPALLVYNGILGGFPHSKLFANVREKASLAYYASSRLEGLLGYLFIYAGIDSDRYEEARALIEQQLKDLEAGRITDEELAYTRSGLVNQYLQSDDPPLTGAALQMYARYTGRAWTVPELIAAIRNVERADVVRVARGVQLDTVYFLRGKGGGGQ